MVNRIRDWRDSGLEGNRKRGIQERRVQDMRHAEQEGCGTGEMLDMRDSGKVECWTGGMQE